MASSVPPTQAGRSLGTVVVLGGCGFFGYHLVQALLQDRACGQIIVLSRNPTVNLHEGVTYRACNITDAASLGGALDEFQPRVIFHAAAPRPNEPLPRQEFIDTNVKGTQAVLDCAVAAPSVEVLVYTSTINTYDGAEHINLDEEQPLCTEKSVCIPYDFTKAEADRMVRRVHGPSLKTVCLRAGLIIGERDNAFVPGLIDAPTNAQMGDNKNMMDAVSASNCAEAHLIAAKALLDPDQALKVGGEAFNIIDGNPIPFWDLSRMLWRAAGRPTDKYVVIPVWLAMWMAQATEWAFFVFTLGKKKPMALNTLVVLFCVNMHTYNPEKARRVLGFNPVSNLEDELKRSVEWELENRKGKPKSQ